MGDCGPIPYLAVCKEHVALCCELFSLGCFSQEYWSLVELLKAACSSMAELKVILCLDYIEGIQTVGLLIVKFLLDLF